MAAMSSTTAKPTPFYGKGSRKNFHPLIPFINLPCDSATFLQLRDRMGHAVLPQWKDQRLVPSRYTYFRQGDLFFSAPPSSKMRPAITLFYLRENERQTAALQTPYFPFEDAGAPLNSDGSLTSILSRNMAF